MNDKIKSALRHLITFVTTFGALIGLGAFIPALDFIGANLDAIWGAITFIISTITTLIAFFSPKVTEHGLESRFTIQRRLEVQHGIRKAA